MKQALDFKTLREQFRSGEVKPIDVVEEVFRRIDERGEDHVWISLLPRDEVRARAIALGDCADKINSLPLYGLTFGIKDNVDVQGISTTCGCPGYSTVPARSAVAVQRAIDAGAVFIGKQSLDQFATGLNGTRTLGGHCKNTVDPTLIPGGSSSGSGVAVAAGLVSFSLGSDTGGSGRVPAAMNNIVGLRPSMGLVSADGMVVNNRAFDCIPIFTLHVDDALAVLGVIADDEQARARKTQFGNGRQRRRDRFFPAAIPVRSSERPRVFRRHRICGRFQRGGGSALRVRRRVLDF